MDNEFIRTHQTAAETELLFQIPVTRYNALTDPETEISQDAFSAIDLVDRIRVLNPCPAHVMVCILPILFVLMGFRSQ